MGKAQARRHRVLDKGGTFCCAEFIYHQVLLVILGIVFPLQVIVLCTGSHAVTGPEGHARQQVHFHTGPERMAEAQYVPDVGIGILEVRAGIVDVALRAGAEPVAAIVHHLIVYAEEGRFPEGIGHTGVEARRTHKRIGVIPFRRLGRRQAHAGDIGFSVPGRPGIQIEDGRRLEGGTQAQAGAGGTPQRTHLQINAPSLGIEDALHLQRLETGIGIGVERNGREFIDIRRSLGPVFRLAVTEDGNAQVHAPVEFVGEVEAHVEEHIVLVALGLHAVLLEERRQHTAVLPVLIPVGKAQVAAVHRAEDAAAVGHHISPGQPVAFAEVVQVPPAVPGVRAGQRALGIALGRRSQCPAEGVGGIDAGSIHAAGVICGGIVQEAERNALEPVTAPGIDIGDHAQVRQFHAGIERTDAVSVSKFGIVARGLCHREGQRRAHGNLGVTRHGRAGRIDTQGAQVSPHGSEGIAQGNAAGRTAIFIFAVKQGILPGLGRRRYSQRRCQSKEYNLFHDSLQRLTTSA